MVLIGEELDIYKNKAVEEGHTPRKWKRIICWVMKHVGYYRCDHFYNRDEKFTTISVQEVYCVRCGVYKYTACIYDPITACDDSPQISKKLRI